ncbi:thiamine pyrophosphate-dependent enzyme [Amycolatopsis sp., V23-08]|uniref:Thiamine pyrophosphate-dependent enzyme n=1 Tax=Amycolatopsis heterodermiae TaxID=3110235 RepID=A0ABU5R250_9PSEU|nr:thiamine pyrophosphate-dependent enzyme [Amycolatopsis sp., V23-08]MEA5360278.1 thiamine pyrophosphate-dependent enzyme [Amycolatopsis sp., V23-08]
MNKTAAVSAVLDAVRTEPIVFTTGYACRIARGIADRPNHFYMTGSMGLASSIAIGIGQQTKRPTVVVDGDGSLLMNPVGLLTAGSMRELPLVHVVLDDGRYASTGGQAVAPAGADFAALALACGYRDVRRVTDVAALGEVLREQMRVCASPVFVHCVLSDVDDLVSARVDLNLHEYTQRLRGHLRGLLAA